jgi:hypothetical protein
VADWRGSVQLQTLDLVIIAAYVVVTLAIGLIVFLSICCGARAR